jgi:hypothetical protein
MQKLRGRVAAPQVSRALSLYRGPLTARNTVKPSTRNTTNIARKMKNKTFAIPIEAPATPVNPSNPATSPMIRKMAAHRNISFSSGICRLNNASPKAAFPEDENAFRNDPEGVWQKAHRGASGRWLTNIEVRGNS